MYYILQAHGKMETLVFSGNTFGIEACKAIGRALETHKEFKNAQWKDMFTGRMKTEIPPALQHLSRGIMTAGAQLVELDLRYLNNLNSTISESTYYTMSFVLLR